MQTVAAATCSSAAAAAAAFGHAAVFAEGTGVSTITALQKRLFHSTFPYVLSQACLGKYSGFTEYKIAQERRKSSHRLYAAQY